MFAPGLTTETQRHRGSGGFFKSSSASLCLCVSVVSPRRALVRPSAHLHDDPDDERDGDQAMMAIVTPVFFVELELTVDDDAAFGVVF